MEYSLTKAILAYKPENVLKSIYEQESSESIVKEIIKFLNERIDYDIGNIELKEREISTFKPVSYTHLVNRVEMSHQPERALTPENTPSLSLSITM